jgi:hypothetical protein
MINRPDIVGAAKLGMMMMMMMMFIYAEGE